MAVVNMLRGLRGAPQERGQTLQRGQTLVEYALIIMLIALVVVGAVGLFGEALENAYNNIASAIPTG